MNYQIEFPRKSFDGLCRFLQQWAEIYVQPGAVLFRGSIRMKFLTAGAVVPESAGLGDAHDVAMRYDTARHALGRCKVGKQSAIVDLRDLDDDEMDALDFVARVAKLKPQQTQVMERMKRELRTFRALPAMVRIALAAKD